MDIKLAADSSEFYRMRENFNFTVCSQDLLGLASIFSNWLGLLKDYNDLICNESLL